MWTIDSTRFKRFLLIWKLEVQDNLDYVAVFLWIKTGLEVSKLLNKIFQASWKLLSRSWAAPKTYINPLNFVWRVFIVRKLQGLFNAGTVLSRVSGWSRRCNSSHDVRRGGWSSSDRSLRPDNSSRWTSGTSPWTTTTTTTTAVKTKSFEEFLSLFLVFVDFRELIWSPLWLQKV